ncbi:hypothetical protein B0T25DRAFT_293520 [Lasiosphaeria hispida]|uniref:Rhodopsin domain-containing protein n=1 Tax=Lasiosphaeria hispida TaxID=260671 RepID=A0AAJ0HCG9_9PEZI|nr:hypothetical protein B0T25DRAFT_293520 [Lasiosphaeria hispida]
MDVTQALVHERAIELGTRIAIIYGFMGAFAPLSFIIIFLRMYSRWRFSHIGLDDVFALLGFALYMGLIMATVFATQYGLGHHIWTISEEAGVLMQKCGFTSQVLYPSALGAVKVSIVLFFIRCLPVVHDRKNALFWLASFIAVEELTFTIALFAQCQPLSFYWDKTIEGGTCFNQPAFYYADAALNLATDLCILSLPWILFRKLNVSKRHRYTVVGICSLSVFTLISSIVRLPYLLDLNLSKDPTCKPGLPALFGWSVNG